MRCRRCGAENLDGASRCSICSAPLGSEPTTGGRGGGHAALWIGLVGAAALAIVLFVMLGAGGSGGGGGGGGAASPSPSGGQPVGKEEKAAVRDAEAFLKKNYRDLLKAPRTVSTEDVGGHSVTTVSYAGTMKVRLSSGAAAEIPRVVIVTRDATTGRTTFSVSD